MFWLKYSLKWFLLTVECLFLSGLEKKQNGGVVVIRVDAIGDFTLWLDTAKEYRRLYSNEKITLIANATWADLAKQLPYWDEVWSVNISHLVFRQPLKRWRLLRSIRIRGFHTAIQPTFSRVLTLGDSVVRATGATHCIGSVGEQTSTTTLDQQMGNRWYTKLLPASPNPMMELLRNAEFFNNLAGIPHKAALAQWPKLVALPSVLQPTGPYFIVFPGASWVGRQWPVAQFAAALVALQRHHGWQPVLCGSPSEAALCEAIGHAADVNCINLAGQTNLSELAEVIRSARLLIGNETSAVHIAAAVGTPSVCIVGGGHYGRFMPYPDTVFGIKPLVAATPMPCYNCNWLCSQPHDASGPVPCINNISVATVLSAAQKALNAPLVNHAIQASVDI